MTRRTLCLSSALLVSMAACGGTDATSGSESLTGAYVATVFAVTPSGQPTINVLAAGGSLNIAIAANGTTTGNLSIPASVTGGAPFTASMAGTAVLTGSTVRFNQTADSFVRDLTWGRDGPRLTVINQTAGAASYTLTLSPQ